MPQMSPIMWLSLFISIISIIMLVQLIMHFLPSKPLWKENKSTSALILKLHDNKSLFNLWPFF
uniref:ATP synthase F0 subunit 8 n=1 Tax=Stygobromus pizzinii TaxID=2027546 RepID=A0A6C0X4U9_9CRUS|nr:ATP synthase F0 subunit 8 [Stygobromus pizzinii]QIC54395.1 ATP synthase F0 subunit 8 [Stygobromus pizzinii]